MPRSTREWIKRKIEYAAHDIEVAQNHLVEAGQLYKDSHPEYYNKFAELVSTLEVIKAAVSAFREVI